MSISNLCLWQSRCLVNTGSATPTSKQRPTLSRPSLTQFFKAELRTKHRACWRTEPRMQPSRLTTSMMWWVSSIMDMDLANTSHLPGDSSSKRTPRLHTRESWGTICSAHRDTDWRMLLALIRATWLSQKEESLITTWLSRTHWSSMTK